MKMITFDGVPYGLITLIFSLGYFVGMVVDCVLWKRDGKKAVDKQGGF